MKNPINICIHILFSLQITVKEILFANDFSGNSIDLSSYKNGAYFINIKTDKGTHIKKIILTK